MYFYSQSTGRLQRNDSHTIEEIGVGYAGGNCGKNPEGVNNTAMEGVICVGPLPRNVYTICPPVEGTHLGPCAMPLLPAPPTSVMLGRGGFFIHADNGAQNHTASEGCIVLSSALRERIANGLVLDNQLTVTA